MKPFSLLGAGLVASFVLVTSPMKGAEACDTDIATPVTSFDSAEVLQDRLSGVWLFCGTETAYPALGSVAHDAIEIGPDGRAYLVTKDGAGQFVRKMGFDSEFTSSVIKGPSDEAPSFAWRLESASGYAMIAPSFTEAYDGLRLDNMGNRSVYRRVAHPVVAPVIQGVGLRGGREACDKGEALIINKAVSAEVVRQLLVGKWWDCKRTSEEYDPMLPPDVYGLVFEANDTLRYIRDESGGASLAPEDQGTYEIEKFEGHYQINLHLPDGKRAFLGWAFSQAPVKARFEGAFFDGASIVYTEATFSGMP